MPESRELSFPGGLAYTGGNAYAYAYTGSNAYAYSAPAEGAGIGGFGGEPLLSAAIVATRDALLAGGDLVTPGQPGDRRTDVDFDEPAPDGLPAHNCARDLPAYGSQVRASLALFEMLSSLQFHMDGDIATLQGKGVVDGQPGWKTVATMQRPNRDYFVGQLQQVDAWASRRDVRAAEVLSQIAPPLGFFASLLNMQAGRHRRTLELVNAALQFTYAVTMQFKHALACPRPGEYSVGMQAMIETPMHPSLPAGHAAEAHVTAAVLGRLAGAAEDSTTDRMLRRLAQRIAQNRVVAGVHFPVDLAAGRLLGDACASYFFARCGQTPNWAGGSFAVVAPTAANGASDDFDDEAIAGIVMRFAPGPRNCCAALADVGGVPSPLLEELWAEAAAEWRRKPA